MNNELIYKQTVIDEITEYGSKDIIYMSVAELKRRIEHLPPAHPEQQWIPVTEESVIQAGYEGREMRFRLRGRLFAIRELAQ